MRKLAWAALAAVVLVALVIGVTDRTSPTNAERARNIGRTVMCPACSGETVADSQAPVAVNIRKQITRKVAEGESDDEIRSELAATYGDRVILNPPKSGIAGLVWVLPVAALVAAVGALVLAFRRWSRSVNPDDLADLEEQRSFLKRSLDDLERELAAGDIGPDDAETLRHDYGTRLASVDAAIESGHVELVRNAPPRRPGRAVAVLAVIAVLAVGLGFGAAHFLGSRGATQSATGNIRQSTAERLQQAEQLSTKGKILEALKIYDRVLDGDPENVDALVGRGLTLVRATMATGRTDFAADGQTFIERALKLQPNDPVILFYLGLSLRLQGKTDDARAAIDRALAADPPPALRTQIEQFQRSLG